MNMEFVRKLPVPLEIKEAYPQSFAMAQVKAKWIRRCGRSLPARARSCCW